jgi:hypothetical protein
VSNTSIHALVFGVIGLLPAVAGGILIRNTRAFRRTALRTHGQVVRLRMQYTRSSTKGRPGRVFYPTLSFTTQDGLPVVAESNFGSNPPAAEEGAIVPVLYDPNNPRRVRVDNLRGSGMLPGGIMLGFGLVIASFGALIAFSQG